MKSHILTTCLLSLFLFSGTVTATEFLPWAEDVFVSVEKEYGAKATKRVRYLHKLIMENQDLAIPEKLTLANNTLNNLPWIADAEHWKNADYWATPMETISTFGGDCEDIAIVKWVFLNHLGIPNEHLRLGYVVIKRTGEKHMVLLYVENPSAPPEKQNALVLDNYTTDIKKGSERNDLIGVYFIDAKDTITLIANTDNKPTIKAVFTDRKMKKFDDLKKKIVADRLKYQKLNDGRPLLPPHN